MVSVVGSAQVGDEQVVRAAVPAEDRMQAFLWRHLVPAKDLRVLVFDPNYRPAPKRIPRAPPPPVAVTNAVVSTNSIASTNAATGTNTAVTAVEKPKFTKQQIAGRLKELRNLFEAGMLSDEFYNEKVAELETAD